MIIVLGRTGFIGGHLCHYFSQTGRQVVAPFSWECNLTKPDRVREWFSRVETPFDLIHCAVINRNQCQDYSSFLQNCQMMQNVLDAMPAALCRSFVYLGSVDVYGSRPTCPITENTVPSPDHYYGLAKLTCERLLRLFPGKAFPAAVLRLPGVYGAQDGGRSLVGKLIRTIVRRQPVTLFGTGGLLRDYVSVDDLALVIDALLARPLATTINVATGQSRSLLDMVKIISEKVGCGPDVIFRPQESPDADLRYDTAQFREVFPAIRLTPLPDGIERYLADLDDNSLVDS